MKFKTNSVRDPLVSSTKSKESVSIQNFIKELDSINCFPFRNLKHILLIFRIQILTNNNDYDIADQKIYVLKQIDLSKMNP